MRGGCGREERAAFNSSDMLPPPAPVAVLPVCGQNRGSIVAEHPKFLSGERAQNVEGDHACRYAVLPQPVDGFHGGMVGGTEHEKQNLGVLVPVGTAEGKFPAGEGGIFRKQLRQLVPRGSMARWS